MKQPIIFILHVPAPIPLQKALMGIFAHVKILYKVFRMISN